MECLQERSRTSIYRTGPVVLTITLPAENPATFTSDRMKNKYNIKCLTK